MPIVADVDGDGYAELVAAANNGETGENGIIVFGERNGTWPATRSIWNQHSYHISNINDDGSIPRQEPKGWQLYNSYRANALPAPPEGLLAPDLLPSFARFVPGEAHALLVRIGNAGSAPAPSGIFVAAFAGDPRRQGSLLGVGQTTGIVGVGEYLDVSVPLTNSAPGEIWIVVDNDGTGHGKVDTCQKENDFYPTTLSSPITNAPPRFASEPLTHAQEGLPYAYTAVATDPDDQGPVRYSLLLAPVGMTIIEESGKIDWTPDAEQGGGHSVEIAATDSHGNTSVQTFLLAVEDRLNLAPRVESLPPSGATTIRSSTNWPTRQGTSPG